MSEQSHWCRFPLPGLSLSHKFFSISADLSYHSLFLFFPPSCLLSILEGLSLSISPALFPPVLLMGGTSYSVSRVITSPLCVTIFLFLSHPPIWMLIAILWVYLKHHIVREKIRTTGSSFPSSSVTRDTHGFFGQGVSPGSRMKSQLLSRKPLKKRSCLACRQEDSSETFLTTWTIEARRHGRLSV